MKNKITHFEFFDDRQLTGKVSFGQKLMKMKKTTAIRRKERTPENIITDLAACGLTNIEIATALGYDENTLQRNYEIFLTKGRSNLKEKLRRKQIKVALQGNVVMLIWLGKQYLNQADAVKESNEIKILLERKELTANAGQDTDQLP